MQQQDAWPAALAANQRRILDMTSHYTAAPPVICYLGPPRSVWQSPHAVAPQVVLLLDADFVVSTGLHEKLSNSHEFGALVEDTATHRTAIVLPAFETEASLGIDQGSLVASQAQQSEPPRSSCMQS